MRILRERYSMSLAPSRMYIVNYCTIENPILKLSATAYLEQLLRLVFPFHNGHSKFPTFAWGKAPVRVWLYDRPANTIELATEFHRTGKSLSNKMTKGSLKNKVCR